MKYECYIGIDYSGAKSSTDGLTGIRIYKAFGRDRPVEVNTPENSKKYWSRKITALWLIDFIKQYPRTLVGIDHGFSFPLRYFDKYSLPHDWYFFLDDFKKYWPTHLDSVCAEDIRQGVVGNGNVRLGDSKWRRITEILSKGGKSVFHFDVQGSVAKSTHCGLPWLALIKQELNDYVHFWPFDGWTPNNKKALLAEVYPSLWNKNFSKGYKTSDQHDAFCIAAMLQKADSNNDLVKWLNPSLNDADKETAKVEGWILGLLK